MKYRLFQSPSSVTTDSGSINDEVDNNEAEQETSDSLSQSLTIPSLPVSSSASSISLTPTLPTETPKPVKIETVEEKPSAVLQTPVSVISSSKPSVITSESPLNVSIRLPDDINERKNLIKRNLDHPELKEMKFTQDGVKFNSELKKELKTENPTLKIEKEIKDEIMDMPDKFKTELIIPKVVPMDKVIIKEEQESSNEALNMNINTNKEEIYKENLYIPQNIVKEPIGFNIKDQHIHHPMVLKEPQIERSKEQMKPDSFVYNPHKEPLNHSLSSVVKMEPRDEPIELTSSNKSEAYPQNLGPQPLNIPTIIPMSQQQRQESFEEEKRNEKLERPERLDRPERQDLSNLMATSIGQPPLPSLMQSGNLVTIGGGQQPLNHYGYMPGPYNPHSPRSHDKTPQAPSNPQNEPQNLKIKQEIPDNLPPSNQNHLMYPQMTSQPQGNMVQQLVPTANIPQPTNYSNQQNLPSTMNDPLQSLKDVKVPGFNLPSAVSQPVAANERPASGPNIDIVKKEPEFGSHGMMGGSPAQQPPTEKSPAPKNPSNTPTPVIAQTPPPSRQTGKFLCLDTI